MYRLITITIELSNIIEICREGKQFLYQYWGVGGLVQDIKDLEPIE